jgi:hypothetical protein
MRASEFVVENYSSTQVLKYIKAVHPRGEFTIDHVVKNYPEWELDQVPLSQIHLPSQEGNEVSPYNQIYDIDYDYVKRIGLNDIKNKPVVLDANGWIIDGVHRVTAAELQGVKTIPAWVPVIDPDHETYDQFMARNKLNELKIDNARGLGQVPLNQNIDYQGLQVAMRPSMFLRLALPLDSHDPNEMKTINYIQQHIDEPGIGAPFLNIEIPEAWESGKFDTPARVVGHDGRHRMYAVLNHQGDEPVEVHMFPRYLRRRHLTDEIIEHLRNGIVGQQGNYVRGPIFGEAK